MKFYPLVFCSLVFKEDPIAQTIMHCAPMTQEAFVSVHVYASSCASAGGLCPERTSLRSCLWIINEESRYQAFHNHFPAHSVASRHFKIQHIYWVEEVSRPTHTIGFRPSHARSPDFHHAWELGTAGRPRVSRCESQWAVASGRRPCPFSLADTRTVLGGSQLL